MEYIDMMKLKSKICDNYISHYTKDGYISLPSLPLDNKEDITLDFTTCTVCTAKKNIIQQKKGNNYVMIQPALRNTHIETLGKVNSDEFFFSFFTMMGGFKYYSNKSLCKDEFSDVIKKEFDFLKIYNDTIILTIPFQYKIYLDIEQSVLNYLVNEGCIIKYSVNDTENLKWKYGIDNVVGYGTRWEISNGGDLVNWGNTINVIINDEPFGVDFGGGVESLLYAHLHLKNSIYANNAMTDKTQLFCSNNSLKEKIIDCIISSMCIISNKDQIIIRDKYILETYMSILNSLMIICDVTKERIMEIVEDINSSKILFLHSEKMTIIFLEYLEKAKSNHLSILGGKNIDRVLNLLKLCYNTDNDWINNKRIIKSHYNKYFSNLSEVELLALEKTKEKLKRKETKK